MTAGMRVSAVEPGTRPDLAELEDEIRRERRGEIALLYKVLLASPPIASGWERMLTAVRNRTDIPDHLRELVILRIAVVNRAPFEYDAHLPLARAAGVTTEQLDAIAEPLLDTRPFGPLEEAVLRLTDAMTISVDVPDEIADPLAQWFDDRGLVELVATIAAYNMVSRFLVALRITHD
ncbi:carboxymuconolactone decarboxylase family protein [Cnuibacter physcomitrellae]|uniref:carboxymuconolactone decarboxylase family protein n=1 Tax=Cnuibacter physcomitrellae TaxID=1619308 RepID=UPI002175D8E7|nr:carboxymuconolactone decarboxylase family protein [Cnuibacter physcomitrellae]MCS5498238.1 carboxymuconolactone decarboxylase family protein [Cnuibacter physcomitrellae]